ncbi:hypothetical protein AHAS_Ahas12G0131200 [Arachis hypogaea]
MIFGFDLVLDEIIASYTWLLENLLEVMCQKQLSVVVMDRDEAMQKITEDEFGLRDSPWENKVFDKKEIWDNAYLHTMDKERKATG